MALLEIEIDELEKKTDASKISGLHKMTVYDYDTGSTCAAFGTQNLMYPALPGPRSE